MIGDQKARTAGARRALAEPPKARFDRLRSAAASVARVEKPSNPAFIRPARPKSRAQSADAYAEPGGRSFPFELVRAAWLKSQFLGLGGPARTYRKAECRSTRHLDDDIRNHKHSVSAAFGHALSRTARAGHLDGGGSASSARYSTRGGIGGKLPAKKKPPALGIRGLSRTCRIVS
jgi:hypothetical protein